MSRASMPRWRSRPRAPAKPVKLETGAEKAPDLRFVVDQQNDVCRTYSSVSAIGSEVDGSSRGQGDRYRGSLSLAAAMNRDLPPFALTKVDAIQNPRPDPGIVPDGAAAKGSAAKLLLFVRRYPDALIGHRHVHAIGLATHVHGDRRTGRGIFGRILQKLSEASSTRPESTLTSGRSSANSISIR